MYYVRITKYSKKIIRYRRGYLRYLIRFIKRGILYTGYTSSGIVMTYIGTPMRVPMIYPISSDISTSYKKYLSISPNTVCRLLVILDCIAAIVISRCTVIDTILIVKHRYIVHLVLNW